MDNTTNLPALRSAVRSIVKQTDMEFVEAVDALAGKLTKRDISAVKAYINKGQPIEGESKLTHYERFLLRGEDVYLYMLGKYNSKTRARVLAGMCCGFEISPTELKAWEDNDPAFKDNITAAREAFKDTIREELANRALIGVEKPVFDKQGNHTHDITVKSDKLLEKMLSANCDEYKEKIPTALNAGGITFNVVSFATEQQAQDAVRMAQEHSGKVIEAEYDE